MTQASLLLLGLAGIALLLGLWPFGIYQASLMAARRLHRFPPTPRSAGSGAAETFAICLCAYNERAVIREKVEDLLRMREAANGALDILVYVDAASDGTTEILEAYRDRIELHVSPERRGKTYGMNLLVSRTKASIIMFTDANVLIDPSAVAVLRRYFADPDIGCVCSSLTYVNTEDSATAAVGGAYWRFNEWTKALETATGSVIGADGSLFAIRSRLHRNVPKGLFDDIYVSLGVLLQGYRVVTAPELLAFETHSTVAQDEYRRKIRIACECMHVHFTLWSELRRLDPWNLYKYVSHRLFRWIGGYFLALATLLLLAALALLLGPFRTLALVAAGGVGFWLLLRLEIGIAGKLWNVLLAFIGTSVGVWQAWRGQRAVTWESPQSARGAMGRQ
jgi:cellulose synthase/poly-beta-1,6-N-acetylglucosamine synthase-like glycosyltransferase